jgi:hypothetical protein
MWLASVIAIRKLRRAAPGSNADLGAGQHIAWTNIMRNRRLSVTGGRVATRPLAGRAGLEITVREIDFINGSVVRWGDRSNVPTPVNRTLVACVKGIEHAQAAATAA